MCECLTHALFGMYLFFHAAPTVELPCALVSHHLPLQGEKMVWLAPKLLQNLAPFGAGRQFRWLTKGGRSHETKADPAAVSLLAHAELQNY